MLRGFLFHTSGSSDRKGCPVIYFLSKVSLVYPLPTAPERNKKNTLGK
jgi:hypothetical protein